MSKPKKINKAWIVRWVSLREHTDEVIKKYCPRGNPIDILSSRKSFNQVSEYAKDIYILQTTSLIDKFSFAKYSSGNKTRNDYLNAVSVCTHYQSKWYSDLLKNESISPKVRADVESKYPKFIRIGGYPYLEACEVYNVIYRTENDQEILLWEEKTIKGEMKQGCYRLS